MELSFLHHFFYDFPHSVYYFALLFAAITGIVCFRDCASGFRFLAVLLWITVASEAIAKFMVFELLISNNIVYHIYTPVEFCLYAIIYCSFLKSNKWKPILIGLVVFIVICELINSMFFQGLDQTNTNTIIIESVLLILLSLQLFLKMGETAIFQNITMSGVFWFNSAVLIYYSFNILVWGFHNIKVYQLKNPPFIIYDLLLILSGLLYLTYAVSIILHTYNIKTLNSDERI